MIVKNVGESDLWAALNAVNLIYGNNVIWNREPEYIGQTREGSDKWRCTLRVIDSRGPGAKLSIPRRRKQRHTIGACWHVHGDFFDSLPEHAEIVVDVSDGRRIIHPGDAWIDIQVGSIMYPYYMSELCECGG